MIAREAVRHVATVRETDDVHLVRIDSEVFRELQNHIAEEERVELVIIHTWCIVVSATSQRESLKIARARGNSSEVVHTTRTASWAAAAAGARAPCSPVLVLRARCDIAAFDAAEESAYWIHAQRTQQTVRAYDLPQELRSVCVTDGLLLSLQCDEHSM